MTRPGAKRRQGVKISKPRRTASNVRMDGGQSASLAPELRLVLDAAVQRHAGGELHAARTMYEAVLDAAPREATAWHLLGVLLHQAGNDALAVEHITKALELRPGYADAHYNLGNILGELGQSEDATAHYRKAVDFLPGHAEAHYNLGLAQQELGNTEDAIAHLRIVTGLKPDNCEAHLALGNALLVMGRFDEAAACYRKAIEIDPAHADAHRHLAVIVKHSEPDKDIRLMQDAFARPGATGEQRMHLAFALGKACEDLQQYGDAFDYFSAGNTLKRGTISFDIEAEEKRFESIKTAFNRALFERQGGSGHDDGAAIFVLGMPRSGTTLVEQILASHPDVHGAGEVGHLKSIIATSFPREGYPGIVGRLETGQLASLGLAYTEAARRKNATRLRVTDKMNDNFLHIGLIKLILPNATIIHCRRNALDTCLSIYKNYFSTSTFPYAYSLEEICRYYRLYDGLMTHWHRVLPGFVHDIVYEDLVGALDAQSRSLLAHCGLEWNDACLDFHRTERPVNTASAAQVRQPIYNSSVESWKRYESQLAPLLKLLQ